MALGLGQLARLVQQAAEVDVGVGVTGVERQRLTVSVHGVDRVGLLERPRDPVKVVGRDLAGPRAGGSAGLTAARAERNRPVGVGVGPSPSAGRASGNVSNT